MRFTFRFASRTRLILLSAALAAIASQPAAALRPFGNTCGGTLTSGFMASCQVHNGWTAYLRYVSTLATCMQMCCKVSSDGSAVCVSDPGSIRDHKLRAITSGFYFPPEPQTPSGQRQPVEQLDDEDEAPVSEDAQR